MTETKAIPIRNGYNVASRYMCPDCKNTMNEVDRIVENGYSFVWYECTRDGCDGQWLEKTSIVLLKQA